MRHLIFTHTGVVGIPYPRTRKRALWWHKNTPKRLGDMKWRQIAWLMTTRPAMKGLRTAKLRRYPSRTVDFSASRLTKGETPSSKI